MSEAKEKLAKRFGQLLTDMPDELRWEARWVMVLVLEEFLDTYVATDFVWMAEESQEEDDDE